MKKIFNKKILIILLTIAIIVIIQRSVFATGAQAASTTNSLTNKTASYYFEMIRQMETATGTLGKASNIGEGYVDTSKNGIDCHLEKSTEYGTTLFLALSEYGNADSSDSVSTANNNTGVFQMCNGYYDTVANIYKETEESQVTTNDAIAAITSADSRYVNTYIGSEADYTSRGYIIKGDALLEFKQLATMKSFVSNSAPIFVRGWSTIHGYSGSNGTYAHRSSSSSSSMWSRLIMK